MLPDKGYSRDVSRYLIKVILETCHDEGYSRDVSCYLIKVILETCHALYQVA
jgi:hypothetical protein